MTSEKCTIQVHVRRTGDVISIEVIPMVTTFDDITKVICQRIEILEPSHYYIAMNYTIQMPDEMLFEPRHENQQFQLVMRTKWLLEHIAERTRHRQLHKEMRYGIIADALTEEDSTTFTSINEDAPTATDAISNPSTSTSKESPEPKKSILGDVVRSTIRRMPRRDVQDYLHTALNKSFDILLMGSPRVGKSTLINAILKKSLAVTSAGRNACTSEITHYEYKEVYTSSTDDQSPITSACSIRIWDAPGIEDWTKLDVTKHIHELLKEKNPICLIYCASPGSYADLQHLQVVIEQCKKLKVFIALVVTNMFASDEVDEILETFCSFLAQHSAQTKADGEVFHYGTVGLCTAVNSVEYEVQEKVMPTAGVDELMLGIMNSLSEEKLLQWCFAIMDNGPFWIRVQSRLMKTFKYFKSQIGF